jgi:hypothetical protein
MAGMTARAPVSNSPRAGSPLASRAGKRGKRAGSPPLPRFPHLRLKYISANFLRLVPVRRKTRGLTARQALLAQAAVKAELRRRAEARLQSAPLYSEADLLDPNAGTAPLFTRSRLGVPPSGGPAVSAVVGRAATPAPPAAPPATPSPPKPKKRFFLRPRYDGVPDILDAIQELGGIASPSQSRHADKGDFDGFAEALTGPARLLIRRRGGLMPDQLVNALTDQEISTGQTCRLESTSDLYDAITAAVAGRAADKKQAARDMVDQEFYEAALTNKPRRGGCATPIPAGQLKVGDRFKVKRDQCQVHDLDPDTSDIDVRCSPKFGRQKLPDGSSVFPDDCRVESSNPVALDLIEDASDFIKEVKQSKSPPKTVEEALERYKRNTAVGRSRGEQFVDDAEFKSLWRTFAQRRNPAEDREAQRLRFLEMVAKQKQEQQARIDAAFSAAGNSKTIKLLNTDGRMMIVARSTRTPGVWQLSWFTRGGDPSGHAEFATRDEALLSAIGVRGKTYGPPHGDRGFQVVAANGRRFNPNGWRWRWPGDVDPRRPLRGRRRNPDLFGAPESVEEQKQRLADEEARRLKTEQREELRRRAASRLTGRGVDTTGDLFEDQNLFAVRRKNPVFLPNEPARRLFFVAAD